jgi:hypothetical protein
MNKKEELAEMVGMRFDEAAELFSEETLLSMQMLSIIGGEQTNCTDNGCINNGCDPAGITRTQVSCSNNGCTYNGTGGSTTSGSTTPCS